MSDLSIAAASALKQEQIQTEVSFAVARKALDAARSQGDAIVQLLEAAASPKSADRGHHFDGSA